jgi:hypothetical protein
MAARAVHRGTMRMLAMFATTALASGCVTVTRKGNRFGAGPGVAMRPILDRQGALDPTAPLLPSTDNPLDAEAVPGAPRHGDPRLEAAERAVATVVASILTGQRPLLELFATW